MVSFQEEEGDRVTVTVSIDPVDNPQSIFPFARGVFGIDPDDLVFHSTMVTESA